MILANITAFSVTIGFLQVMGALGVFLFGMKLMSEAVQRVAGKRMRTALSGLTSNRFSGILTGFLTTSLVQSSSATTVLVVSFVNAGLLTLIQSIGVIMGANLGTTITAWIVAMVGKFNVSELALPLIGLGLPFLFIGKGKGKNWGEMLLGFGLVFFGLGLLKDSVPDVRMLMQQDPGVAATIENIVTWMGGRGFASVLLYLTGGIFLTLLVQSSSAAMAITMMCALNGWLGDLSTDPFAVFQNSAAIVLGENIGTTVTAWLAALGANVHARRAARAHFTFNVLGVIWVLCVFGPFSQMSWWLANHLPESMRGVNESIAGFDVAFATAIFHSTFNFFNILLLVAFVPQIARLVEWWVQDSAPDAGVPKLKYISQGLVNLGELNLAEAESATRRMARLTNAMFKGFVEVLNNPHVDLSEKVTELKHMEVTCDGMLEDITSYLIQCSSHEINRDNAGRVTAMMRIASELEEATDRIYRLVKTVQRKYDKEVNFQTQHDDEVNLLCREVESLLQTSSASLVAVDKPMMERARLLEDGINALRKRHNKASVKRMKTGGDVATEMIFIEINNHLEAIGNLAINVLQSGMQATAG